MDIHSSISLFALAKSSAELAAIARSRTLFKTINFYKAAGNGVDFADEKV